MFLGRSRNLVALAHPPPSLGLLAQMISAQMRAKCVFIKPLTHIVCLLLSMSLSCCLFA